jgi:A nuclease of the HNH/ENDO VII superfamily with conserved WHH
MPDFSLVPVEHQPDFSDVSLIPVDHDPFSADGAIQQPGMQPESQLQRATTYNDPEGDAAAMSPETYVNPFVKRTLGDLATLPQRAIDAAKISAAHNYGPSPDVMSDSDAPFVDPLPSVAAETALTMMGGSGPVPVATRMIPAAKGVAGSVAEGAGAALRGAAPEVGFAHARGDAVEGVGGSGSGGLSANAPTGNFYSVLYETKLKPTSYPGGSRPAHNQEGNENLLQEMEGDADHARIMQDAGVDLRRTPTGLAPRTPPAGFSWHHAEDPGVMQLVPRQQHERGSIFQDILHPGGRGGYSKWGK